MNTFIAHIYIIHEHFLKYVTVLSVIVVSKIIYTFIYPCISIIFPA
jgi:hypothetical protein